MYKRQLKGMGIQYLAVNFLEGDTDYESVRRFQEKAASYGPVSYTHLDVYKRQVRSALRYG